MTPYIQQQLKKLCDNPNWYDDMLISTEGFCEEMNVVYRTEELNTYLRYPKQQINPWHKHSTYIRLKLRDILQIPLTDITIIDIISLP